MTDPNQKLKVLKHSYQHKGEKRYRISIVDTKTGEKFDDLSLDLNESGYNNFVNNGGEQAMCVACDYVSGLKKNKGTSPEELSSLKEDWLEHAETLADDMGLEENDPRRQLIESADEISPLPLSESTKNLKSELDQKVEDLDGDGIPDDQDRIDDRDSDAPGQLEFKNAGKYIDWPEGVTKTGAGGQEMDESSFLPKFLDRKGSDTLYVGKNNTHIVLGRDRTGISDKSDKTKTGEPKGLGSGYGEDQAAGAIDIVVGRGAPYPLGSMELGPLFMTDWSKKTSLARKKLTEGNNHPGYMMDAARIYISQKTDVDFNFGINDSVSGLTSPVLANIKSMDEIKTLKMLNDKDGAAKSTLSKAKVKPNSAIAMKADQIRLIAREEIKLVTSGPEEEFNSVGGKLNSIKGIHLVAGNGEDAFGKDNFQEPIPKGKRLLSAMDALVGLLHDLAAILEAILMSQMEFNAFVMTHFHLSPLFGVPTTPSPLLPFAGMKTMIDHLVRGYLGIIMLRVNLGGFDLNYLKPSSKQYILSRYNTTN